jgi:hypothetical protein
MALEIPAAMILSGILFVAVTQALTLYRVGQLERKFNNGINARLHRIERNCIRFHGVDADVHNHD